MQSSDYPTTNLPKSWLNIVKIWWKWDEIESKLEANESMVESKAFVFQKNDSTSVFYYTDLSCMGISITVSL